MQKIAMKSEDYSNMALEEVKHQYAVDLAKVKAELAKEKPATPTELSKLIAERDALAPNDPNRALYDEKIKKLSQRTGTIIETGPDGTTRIVQGAPVSDLQRKTKGNIEEKLTSGSEQLSRMMKIYDAWKPEYSQLGTRFKAAWTGTKAFLGREIDKQDEKMLTDFKKWQRKSIENINLYIKELTGAQMSEKEADRLRLAQPDPGENWWQGDDPITFKAKMDDVLKGTRAAVARWDYYKNKGLSEQQIVAMINDGRAVSLDELISKMK
jgi:hypothetical protein